MKPAGRGTLTAGARAALWALPLAAALAAFCIGRIAVSPAQLFAALRGEGEAVVAITLFRLRLPRILLSLLVGAGLAAAGAAFQALFANPLATPDTLGVASGASFGAALGILLGFGMTGIQLTALTMGGAAVALTWLGAAGRRARGLSSVVLSGIMIGSLFTALVSFVKYTADAESQLPAITYFLMGSMQSASWRTLAFGAPPVLAGCAVLWALRWRMNLLPLTEDEARAAGVNLTRLRAAVVAAATLITASCVSMCGQVGWVGLLVPHLCRLRFGENHLSLLPASLCVGAAFLTLVDTAARSISAAEIPISILTALAGAPLFILLMRRTALEGGGT